MRGVTRSALRFPLLTVAIAAALIFAGVTQLPKAPVDVLPEFTPPSVEVQTEALGLSAAEVEQLVTVPLEADLLNGVAWLDEIRSESAPGLSSIELIFEPGTDVLRARQMVQERLSQAHALPHVSKPPVMLLPTSSTGRVVMISLSSQKLSLIDMSVLARWQIRPRLMGLPGVANVSTWGQRERQLQVQVDPELLHRNGVTLNQVIRTTGNALWVSPLTFVEASTPGTAGFIDTPNQRLPIRHILPITTPEDLGRITLEDAKGKPLRLGDVAQVVEDHQPLIGDAVVNGGPGLMLVVEKAPGANTVDVTREVEDALDALRPGLSGIDIDTTVFRPATFIESAVGNLTLALILGFALVLLVLAAFFFDWRAVVVGLVAIPLSLMTAGLVLYLRGTTFNVMILVGLVMALGAIVGDAIADVDNIRHRLRERGDRSPAAAGTGQASEASQAPSGQRAAAVVVDAATEVRGPVLYATLVLLTAAVPLFFLAGLNGAFSRPLALSYTLAVLASLAVALTVTPALALLLFGKAAARRRETPLARWLRRGHTAGVTASLRRSRWVLVAAGVVVLAGLAALPALGDRSLLPPLQDRNLLIRWDAAPGTSRPEMVRMMERASAELRATPGVRAAGAHIGRAVTSDRVTGVNSGEVWVSLDDDADYSATVDAIQKVVDGYPGFDSDVRTYPDQRLREVVTGTGDPVVVRVYGQDLAVLRDKADEVRRVLSEVDGVVEPRVDVQAEEPTVEVEVDLAAAQRYGIKPGDVRRAAATLLSGLEVGSLFEEQKVFEVVVWGAPAVRHSLTSIQELLIDTPDGRQVRLKDVAKVRITPNASVIRHDSSSRRVDVTAGVRGRSVDAVVRDVERRLAALDFPVEYHAEVLTAYAERAGARQRTLAVAVAAGIAIFLLLQAAFGSWRLAALVFLTLPVALFGGVLAALAGGGISLGSLVGLLAVLGIAARNGIVLIRHYQHLEREEGEPLGLDLVVRGTQERAVPIVLTAVTTALALLPLLLFGNIPGHEVVRPLAVVMLGGLVTSTLLALFVLPPLYLSFAARPDRTGPDKTAAETAQEPEGVPAP